MTYGAMLALSGRTVLWQLRVMFDFARWCAWTKAEGENLRAKGFVVDFKSTSTPIQKAGLEVSSASTVAVFQFWGDHSSVGNGLADIDAMDVKTKRITLVCTATKVTDDNFSMVFRQLCDAIGA